MHGIELRQGNTAILNISVLDGRDEFQIPSMITLPSGPIEVTVQALGATGLDVTDFSIDEALDNIDRVSAQATTI